MPLSQQDISARLEIHRLPGRIATLLAAALVATALPARRAASISPIKALREE
jgi:ABC-type lipoprotein release transport system permease subunit